MQAQQTTEIQALKQAVGSSLPPAALPLPTCNALLSSGLNLLPLVRSITQEKGAQLAASEACSLSRCVHTAEYRRPLVGGGVEEGDKETQGQRGVALWAGRERM